MTCVKCNGTGQLYTKVANGACLVTACDCEYAVQEQRNFERDMQDFRKRLAQARERFGIAVK
ncbi:hypothetical protein ABET52_06025 [Saccharococcus caldoxylosilyticus]|uniref:hypothetical protein n=1 Tax=Saccharococcus caldoxylosilyticus TaxID=81408 RepID=UPI003D3469DE